MKDATDSQELDIQECTSYRMLAARLNFIAQDNPAIQYSDEESETAHFAKIKKLARSNGSTLGRKNKCRCSLTVIGLAVCGHGGRRLVVW